MNSIFLRAEDRGEWERRVPLPPSACEKLITEHKAEISAEPTDGRAFSNEEYVSAGVKLLGNGDEKSDIIMGIKEVPKEKILSDKTYLFFAHVVKGQSHNMPLLQTLLDKNCTLIDYEKITDNNGKRLVFFGHYAGVVGAVETLRLLGLCMQSRDEKNSLAKLKQPYKHPDLGAVKEEFAELGNEFLNGWNYQNKPLVIGIAGYGSTSGGVQEMLDLLSLEEITPEELLSGNLDKNKGYLCVFKEKHTVQRKTGDEFILGEFYEKPEFYESQFNKYIPKLTVLFNCIYWEDKYPRLVTKEFLRSLYKENPNHLFVIGDISIDVEGAIEASVQSTDVGDPYYVYKAASDQAVDDLAEEGVALMAVDNLPCELPRESSVTFSEQLMPFIPSLLQADLSVDYNKLTLNDELKRAVIAHKGNLTEEFKYLENYLN